MTKKTTKYVWRLKEQPTSENIRGLVKDQIISKDEARQILFNSKDEKNTKDLEGEIKFLRELIDKLAGNRTQVVEVIKQVEIPYRRYDWYAPYTTWCDGSDKTITLNTTDNTSNTMYLSSLN